nr:hypothetical protein [Escherichia coli]
MSYFFVTTLQVFFCIALLSGVLWSRNDPPSLRPLTWTLLTGLIAGVLAGLFIHGSQPVQLLLLGRRSWYRCCLSSVSGGLQRVSAICGRGF